MQTKSLWWPLNTRMTPNSSSRKWNMNVKSFSRATFVKSIDRWAVSKNKTSASWNNWRISARIASLWIKFHRLRCEHWVAILVRCSFSPKVIFNNSHRTKLKLSRETSAMFHPCSSLVWGKNQDPSSMKCKKLYHLNTVFPWITQRVDLPLGWKIRRAKQLTRRRIKWLIAAIIVYRAPVFMNHLTELQWKFQLCCQTSWTPPLSNKAVTPCPWITSAESLSNVNSPRCYPMTSKQSRECARTLSTHLVRL